ncbi:MAG: SCP2 sterol-binding domain-containing protein [Thermoplasmata archaeon]
MIEETLAGVVERFNRHAAQNPALHNELVGLVRTIAIRITDGDHYTLDLKGGRLEALRTGTVAHADITITTDSATFLGLVKREIGPMKALVTRKLAVDGSLEDKLLFRRLF